MASDECFPFSQLPRYSQNFTYTKNPKETVFPSPKKQRKRREDWKTSTTGNELSIPNLNAIALKGEGRKNVFAACACMRQLLCRCRCHHESENEIFPN